MGLRYQGTPPAGIDWIGGALLPENLDYAVSWVDTPDGEMFWLEWTTPTPAVDGTPEFEVIDAVLIPPPVEVDVSDMVILGGTPCQVDGVERTGVVGIFQLSGTEWFEVMLHGWSADLATGQLVPLTGSVRCIDEGWGV